MHQAPQAKVGGAFSLRRRDADSTSLTNSRAMPDGAGELSGAPPSQATWISAVFLKIHSLAKEVCFLHLRLKTQDLRVCSRHLLYIQ